MNLEALIRELKNGNKLAGKDLYMHLRSRCLVTCRRYVRNKEDAEERMSDGFHKFFASIESFQYWHDEGVYAWVKRIMINQCLMQLRNKTLFAIISENEAYDISEQDTILDKLSIDEILNLVERLPLGYRTVFNLFVIDGFDHGQIGLILGIKAGSSKSQLSKARNLLQKMLILNGLEYVKEQSK